MKPFRYDQITTTVELAPGCNASPELRAKVAACMAAEVDRLFFAALAYEPAPEPAERNSPPRPYATGLFVDFGA